MNIDACFEKISKYVDDELVILPSRKTAQSAGYDFCAAEDTIIPPFVEIMEDAMLADMEDRKVKEQYADVREFMEKEYPFTLDRIAAISKKFNAKVALVPTGVKCKIPDGYFLQLSVRSSLPLKHWLILGNGVGIIDADYYNNPDNEGHIYFQIINLLPVPIKIQKGECFGQGILMEYHTAGDNVTTTREGGFGSTNG